MNIFTKHPSSIGESYVTHLRFALRFGSRMLLGGFACIIHGIFPFLFQNTGSNTVSQLNTHFLIRRTGSVTPQD